jgi:hypothetical protein
MDFDKWAFPFVAAARKHLELFGSSFGGMEQTVCDEAVVGEAAVAGKWLLVAAACALKMKFSRNCKRFFRNKLNLYFVVRKWRSSYGLFDLQLPHVRADAEQRWQSIGKFIAQPGGKNIVALVAMHERNQQLRNCKKKLLGNCLEVARF